MSIPAEFTPQAIAAASEEAFTPYRKFLTSGEPYRSLIRNNPWTRPPGANDELEWGKGWYYDTTVGRKHPHWCDIDLPRETKDLRQLRRDLYEWGYCLIEEAVAPEICERIRLRVEEQAAAERALGLAHANPAQQHLWCLVNKGADFVRCLEHDPEVVQAGPLVEALLDETLGPGWNHYSFISNISYPGCHPQGLHQDQSAIAPFTTEAPILVNTIYILQDVDETNGGTLIVPGSHRANAGEDGVFGAIPPAINLEAKAGTIMLMDGRTLHGGAVNRSNRLRYILTNSVVKPWLKQQEGFLLTVCPEVLETASTKLLARLGFLATSVRNMVEGYGYFGSGAEGDPNGSLVHARRAMDRDEYAFVRELRQSDVGRIKVEGFTLSRIQREHETYRTPRYLDRLNAISPT